MRYSETVEPLSQEEKKKQIIIMIVVLIIPLVLAGAGFILKSIDTIWAVFAWVGAGMTVGFLSIPKLYRMAKDDFFSHKIIYKGMILEVRPVKVGVGTASSMLFELVLEKKTLKVGERGVNEMKVSDAPLPVQGEEVEIHALPKSGDILKLLVKRNEKWEAVALPGNT